MGNGWLTFAQCQTGPLLQAVHTVRMPKTMTWDTPGCIEFVRDELKRFCPRHQEAAIWVHLDDGQDELRYYRIPKVAPKEQDTVAVMTAKREKPFDEQTQLFDYRVGGEVIEKGIPRLPVVAMLASPSSVTRLKSSFNKVGIALTGITSGGIASHNLFASGWLNSPWETFALVTLGFESTRIDILENRQTSLSRTIRAGLHSLTSELDGDFSTTEVPKVLDAVLPPQEEGYISLPADSGLGEPHVAEPPVHDLVHVITLDDPVEKSSSEEDWNGGNPLLLPGDPVPAAAAERERPFGAKEPQAASNGEVPSALLFRTNRSAEEDAQLARQLSAPMSRMGRQVERTITYFRNTLGRVPVQGILIAAPDGCLPLLQKRFDSFLEIPSLPLRYDGSAAPGARLDLDRARVTDADVFQALGLALSSDSYTPNALMTYQDRAVLSRRRLLARLVVSGLSLAMVLALIFSVHSVFRFLSLKAERAALEQEVAGWTHRVTPEELQTKLLGLQQQQSRAATLAKRRITAALLSELSAMTPQGVYLTGMRMTFPEEKKEKNPQKEQNVVTVLTGTVTGNTLQRESLLAEFLSRLEQSPLVSSLLVEKQQNDNETISFVATLKMV